MKLTPGARSTERTATIVAPGSGFQSFNLFYIDTLEFSEGGTLDINIEISSNSATDGSFDLFPANVIIPAKGAPVGAVAGSHDVQKGKSTRMSYRFNQGQVLVLGLGGNWMSPKGARGTVKFRASVR